MGYRLKPRLSSGLIAIGSLMTGYETADLLFSKKLMRRLQMNHIDLIRYRIRILIVFFILALTLSGLTAIPLEWELDLLNQFGGPGSEMAALLPALSAWIGRVYDGLRAAKLVFPQIAYGTDWLAFAHIVIAIAFIGPLKNPLHNRWVIEFGMLACILIIPWSLILGMIREIPWFWQLIDMSFGFFGIIPLWVVRRDILFLEALASVTK